MKQWVPWYGRIAAKLILSRIPTSYGSWRGLNLFSHGLMDQADYAYGVFRRHFDALPELKKDFVALEFGPGDSVVSAIVGAAHGVRQVYLVDAGPFATRDMRVYKGMADFLAKRKLRPPDLSGVNDLEEVLARCNATYGSRGLSSLREIPTGSVDFIWSQAVLEHVRRHEFTEIMAELLRVLRPTGLASHVVDLKDHLGGALNNMRIPSRYWEQEWMARSGFYTNRIRMKEMLAIFDEVGFAVQVDDVTRWDSPPTPRNVLAHEFQRHPDSELLVQSFKVTLSPRKKQEP